MNKQKVNQLIPKAYEVLKNVGIVKEGTEQILKSYRAQVSSFGAAIIMGSLLPAIAFFSGNEKGRDQNDERADRSKITKAICELVYTPEDKLFNAVKRSIGEKAQTKGHLFAENEVKEDIINAAIALKLAMNLYHLVEK